MTSGHRGRGPNGADSVRKWDPSQLGGSAGHSWAARRQAPEIGLLVLLVPPHQERGVEFDAAPVGVVEIAPSRQRPQPPLHRGRGRAEEQIDVGAGRPGERGEFEGIHPAPAPFDVADDGARHSQQACDVLLGQPGSPTDISEPACQAQPIRLRHDPLRLLRLLVLLFYRLCHGTGRAAPCSTGAGAEVRSHRSDAVDG